MWEILNKAFRSLYWYEWRSVNFHCFVILTACLILDKLNKCPFDKCLRQINLNPNSQCMRQRVSEWDGNLSSFQASTMLCVEKLLQDKLYDTFYLWAFELIYKFFFRPTGYNIRVHKYKPTLLFILWKMNPSICRKSTFPDP